MIRIALFLFSFAGFLLAGLSQQLTTLRENPSSAYWILTSETSPVNPIHHLILPDGTAFRTLPDAFENYVAWSPDENIIFFSDTLGLHRFHIKSGHSDLVVETTEGIYYNDPNRMMLSPDGKWYLFRTTGSLYAVKPDGSKAYLLETRLKSLSWATWDNSSEWILFYANDERVRRNIYDASQIEIQSLTAPVQMAEFEMVIPSPDRSAEVVLSTEEGWQIREPDGEAEALSFNQSTFQVEQWLDDDTLLLKNSLPDATEFYLYSISINTYQLIIRLEDLTFSYLQRAGDVLFIFAQRDSLETVYRYDFKSRELSTLLEDFFGLMYYKAGQTSPVGSIADDFDYMIYLTQEDNQTLIHRIKSDGSQHQVLYRANTVGQGPRVYFSPDAESLTFNFMDPRRYLLVRINPVTGEVYELPSNQLMLDTSKIVERADPAPDWTEVGLILGVLAGFSSAILIYRRQKS
ncbi:MAG: hypothetical protein L0154_14840 [Chloroflexi bacterium]|nr:hypothetical protein [Chloroflexota bacterium]